MVLGLTLAAGAMVALSGAVADSAAAVIAVPTALLLVFLLRRATAAAGWCAAAVWVFLAPMAPYDGILAPLVMIAACAVIALRPARVAAWLTDGPRRTSSSTDLESAWIEEL
jgi:hypothetical protein